MPEIAQPQPSVLSFSGVLRALFKHKRLILVLTLLGLLSAVAVYFFYPPEYVSEAKLLVRYIVERSGVDPTIDTTARNSQSSDSVIASEAEILNSWDLAVQAAEAVGPQKLLPRARNPTASEAAGQISKGLTVNFGKGSNILFVSYENRDPALAPVVLNELITRYFVKHLEVHRSAGAFDFVTQQTDQVRAQLNQTEDALKPLREKAGIISLASGTAALDAELTKTQDQLQRCGGATGRAEGAGQGNRQADSGKEPRHPVQRRPRTEHREERKASQPKKSRRPPEESLPPRNRPHASLESPRRPTATSCNTRLCLGNCNSFIKLRESFVPNTRTQTRSSRQTSARSRSWKSSGATWRRPIPPCPIPCAALAVAAAGEGTQGWILHWRKRALPASKRGSPR